jgi:GGDEF domain-containing protein
MAYRYGVVIELVAGRPALDPARDPLFGAAIALERLDRDQGAARPLLDRWRERVTSPNPDSERRYPWAIGTRFVELPTYVPDRDTWRAWLPAEEEVRLRERGAFESRLLVGPIVADTCELLARLADAGDDDAKRLLAATIPAMRRDMARAALGDHARGDTWVLWNLARRPKALRRLQAFALAIADTYGARARMDGGIGLGSRFPFSQRALVSVSAQLASGLLALGIQPDLIGHLTAWVADQQRPDGAFGDATEPSDPLTTLVAADLLAGIDPGWNPDAAVRWLERRRRPDRTIVAYGPEAAWLTLAVDDLVRRCARPFAQRFAWPQLAVEHLDRRTGLPFLGYVADVERLFAEVPALRGQELEMAFLDLAGFGAWNNKFGMAAGDDVLRFLAAELRRIPDAVAIRDGGDEFMVVSAPGAGGLVDRMDTFRREFFPRFVGEFGPGALPVAARVVTTTAKGHELVAGRDRLGIGIALLKTRVPEPGPEGVSADLSDLNRLPD